MLTNKKSDAKFLWSDGTEVLVTFLEVVVAVVFPEVVVVVATDIVFPLGIIVVVWFSEVVIVVVFPEVVLGVVMVFPEVDVDELPTLESVLNM